MLTFFRRIRKGLLGDGATSKYLLYAIGEIILVVIGILIALQINNNNVDRKERIFEIKMLNEIREQLILDTVYFNMLIGRCTRIDTSANRIFDFYESGSDNMKFFRHHAENINWSYLFEFHVGAYEALKASGIEKVSSNELRKELIDLYDFQLPRTRHFLRQDFSPEHRVMEKRLEQQIFGIEIRTWEDDSERYVGNGKYSLEKADDPLFLQYLGLKHDQADEGIDRITSALSRVNNVLKLLDKELESD